MYYTLWGLLIDDVCFIVSYVGGYFGNSSIWVPHHTEGTGTLKFYSVQEAAARGSESTHIYIVQCMVILFAVVGMSTLM